MFTRAVPSQRLLLARSQSPSTSQLLLKHSNCLHSAANQLDDTNPNVPGRQAA